MMLTFNQLRTLFGNEPVAIWSQWLQSLSIDPLGQYADIIPDMEARVAPQTQRAVASRAGSVAVIPVSGVITAKPTMWERYGLTTSVESIVRATASAVNDPEVKAVVWDMNTPGGSTNGLVEGHAELMALRGKKPIVAQVDHLSASAGYWLASAADEIASSPSGISGSIGVYMMHADMTGYAEKMGAKFEFIHAGKDKVLGNEFAPLDDEGRAYFQALVDASYADFTGDVARGRGVDIGTVKSDAWGQGRVLTAKDAKSVGMVDVIRSMSQTLAAYGAQQSGGAGDRQRRALALKLLELDD